MDFFKGLALRLINLGTKWKQIICILFLVGIALPVRAAVVEAEDIPRYVDTPTGTVIVRGIPEPPKTSSDVVQSMPAPTRAASKPESKRRVTPDLPEAPSFEAEVEEPAPAPRSNKMFLILGILIVLIGLALVFYLAKQRRDEQ